MSGVGAVSKSHGEADQAPAAATRTVGVGRWVLFWAIALGGMAFDLTTKTLIFERVGQPQSQAVPLIRNVLELQTSYNSGALWGLGRNMGHSHLFFAGLSMLAALAICYYLFVRGAAADWRLTVALGLIMAGAMGNCYDRLVFSQVRDFVHFHVDAVGFDCAIFNFADNMLVAGAICLMLLALRPDNVAALPAAEGEEPQRAAESA
jgi:signal peptidase II